MGKGFLDDRSRALEDSFFVQKNRQLLEKLSETTAATERKEELASAPRVTDEDVRDGLVELEIDMTTVDALALVPLIHVAWADKEMDDKEREAILKSTQGQGISKGSPSYELLESWLLEAPSTSLIDAWIQYVNGLCDSLNDSAKSTLKKPIGPSTGSCRSGGWIPRAGHQSVRCRTGSHRRT